MMCEILEDDWNERSRTAKDGTGQISDTKSLKESLIFRYISGTGAHGANRRIMRAIFADGDSTAVNQFGEVFRNELKELKKDGNRQPKKREVDVDIEEGIYGDYLDNEEDDSDEDDSLRTRPKRSRRSEASTPGEATVSSLNSHNSCDAAHLGGFEAIALRQRLLQLLSTVSANLPDDFLAVDGLYSLIIEFIRHLPIPTFQLFVTASALPYFIPEAHATLCEMLLMRMLENKVPTSNYSFLNQEKLELHFLPYAAKNTSVVDNAKVSILLESLLETLSTTGMLAKTPELGEAIKTGITARGEKAQSASTKSKINKAPQDEWAWLIESGERMIYRVERVPTEATG